MRHTAPPFCPREAYRYWSCRHRNGKRVRRSGCGEVKICLSAWDQGQPCHKTRPQPVRKVCERSSPFCSKDISPSVPSLPLCSAPCCPQPPSLPTVRFTTQQPPGAHLTNTPTSDGEQAPYTAYAPCRSAAAVSAHSGGPASASASSPVPLPSSCSSPPTSSLPPRPSRA